MTDRLVDFVNALDQDPALQQEYDKNPQKTLEAYGVASEDIAILFGTDLDALKKRLDIVGLKAITRISHSK